ncbi:protein AATF/BFR2, partial [Lecanoromycetidae sp. Uapishka_2]
MPKSRHPKSLAEQVADLEDPAPKDFDPEDHIEHLEGDNASGSTDSDNDPIEARRDALLAAESDDYPFGSQIEREATVSSDQADADEDVRQEDADDDEEIDSDEAFGSGDDEKFEGYTFRGGQALRPREQNMAFQNEETGMSDEIAGDDKREVPEGSESNSAEGEVSEEEDSDVEMDDEEEAGDLDSDDTSISDTPKESKSDDRAALRKMMAEEQRTVADSLSKAAKADVTKGRAIKQQRSTFDALLNGRIKLQKALIATNSMSSSEHASSEHTKAISAAESAALNLWNNISALRSSLRTAEPKNRSFSATETSTSSSLWSEMQQQDSSSLANRRATLTKWSQKTNPAAALTRTNKFSQTPSQQPLTSVLDQHLSGSNLEKLVQKTQIPRSCAPLQATAHTTSDPHIYDDADFYTLLLRELVDQRMADSNAPAYNGAADPLPVLVSQKDFKIKKVVDTKASKGRKMRYTVHEKLQNFMAPDYRGSWGERQRAELFGSLLGRKVQMGEDEDVESGGDDEMEGVEGGLRLFG